MLFYTIDRYKWEKDGCLLDICQIFRILAVCEVLSYFESTCTTEHYIYDTDVSDAGNDPVPYIAACTEANDE